MEPHDAPQDPPQTQGETPKTASLIFNKKKFKILESALQEAFPKDDMNRILDVLCSALNFDPGVQTFPKEVIDRQTQKLRDRATELGCSVYALKGKSYYERNRERMINKVRNYQQRVAAKNNSVQISCS